MGQATFQIWRGDQQNGEFKEYHAEVGEGMVVLDAVHQIQATQAPDLACRWNCKAGKCGSCSAEINGKPRLMCMTRMDTVPTDEPIKLMPMKAFPLVKDLVTDVSWNYKINRKIPPFTPRKPDAPDGTWRMSQEEVDRIQEFRKCIECFLCQDTCHVLRDHQMFGEPGTPSQGETFGGPRFMIRVASLDMHPLDTVDRLGLLKDSLNIGLCNITKCCTEVCPEHIQITDNGIIPLKERVVDQYYDPVMWVVRKLFRRRQTQIIAGRTGADEMSLSMFAEMPDDARAFIDQHSGSLTILLLCTLVLGTLLILVPQLLRTQHRWLELQHLERLKSLEQGIAFPNDDPKSRFAGRVSVLVPMVSVCTAGTVTCLFVTYESDGLFAVALSVWCVAGVVSLAAITGGVALMGRLAQLGTGDDEDVFDDEKPIP